MRAAYALIALSVMLAITALMLPVLAQDRAATGQLALLAPQAAGALSPLDRIKAGEINCPGCDLSGADLSHQCVKEGDLRGANFDRVTAHYMCMSYANFAGATFRGADLTGVNLSHSDLSGADLSGAKLDIALLKGADLSAAKGLTQAQLDTACSDADTKLPEGFTPRTCL